MIQISDNNAILTHVRKIIEKASMNRSWKVCNVSFWPKSNMPNDTFKKLLNLETFCNSSVLFLM